MANDPVPRKSADALRQDALNALEHTKAMLKPYLEQAGIFERGTIRRAARDQTFEVQFQGFLDRLEAFNTHVLSQDKAFYAEELFRDIAARTNRVNEVLVTLGTAENPFAKESALRMFEMWMRNMDSLLQQYSR